MLKGPKWSDIFGEIFKQKAKLGKYLREKYIFIKTLSTTSQNFCKIVLNSQVIAKRKIDPDNNLWGSSQA